MYRKRRKYRLHKYSVKKDKASNKSETAAAHVEKNFPPFDPQRLCDAGRGPPLVIICQPPLELAQVL